MEGYDQLLRAQIQQHLGGNFEAPAGLHQLFEAISQSYRQLRSPAESVTPVAAGMTQEEELRARGLFEAAFEGIAIHDHNIILDVNEAGAQMLGYSREELVGRGAFELAGEEDRKRMQQYAAEDYAGIYQASIVRRDGTRIHAEFSSRSHIYQGKPVRVVAFRDITSRRRYEEEIQWQKTLLARVLDSLPIHLFLKDRNGRILFVNRYSSEQTGTSPQDVIGKTDFELFEPALAEKFVADDREVWTHDKPLVREERSEWNGETLYMLSGKQLIHGSQHEESLLLGYALDITDRVRMEEEIREQGHFIRQVLDTNPNPIYVRDHEGRFLMINRALAALEGISKEEFLARNNLAGQASHPDKWYMSHLPLEQEVIEQQQGQTTEDSFTLYNGEVRHFCTIKKPLQTPAGIHVLSISIDITEQKKVMEQLRNSELRYRQIVELATDIIYQCDPLGYCTYINPIGSRTLGYGNGELLGKHFSEVVNEEHREMVIQFYQQQFNSRTPDTYLEFLVDDKNGNPMWIGQTVHMLLEGRRISGFQAVARDITSRKRAEQELLHAKNAAEESVKAKEQFLSVVSHELRTPLNAVIGLTHLLLEKNTEDKLNEYLNAVKFSADNLMRLINDVLDFSKIESGKIRFEQTTFELDSIFQGIRQSFGFEAADKNLKLLFNTEAGLPRYIVGDPVRLQQIFTNLVGNALKFTEKGYVEIGAEVMQETDEQITLLFSVTDSGIGIPAEKVQIIFESFTQASQETARRYGGTGLGLSITKQLVELQGGQINVRSKLGLGSTFSFSLPLGKVGKHPKTPARHWTLTGSEEPAADFSANVLLVEDNPMNQLVTREFLNKWGITTDIAPDGFTALEKLKKTSYELVLLDLQMPGLDGYETARRIRTQLPPYQQHLPILAITASTQTEVKYRALGAGINDILIKPFDPQEFQTKVFRYLSLSPQQPPAAEKILPRHFRYINLEYLENASISSVPFLEEMIRLFLRQNPLYVQKARSAATHEDWKELDKIIHKMKSTTATVGITQLSPAFDRIETLLHQLPLLPVQTQELQQCVEEIAEICERAYAELAESLTSLAELNENRPA